MCYHDGNNHKLLDEIPDSTKINGREYNKWKKKEAARLFDGFFDRAMLPFLQTERERGFHMKKAIRMIWNAASWALVAAIAALAVLLAGARLVGLQVYSVLSGSMEPAYRTGAIVYVKKIEPEDIVPGTVITFALDESTAATHRVVEVVPDEADPDVLRFRTKGDANDAVDGALVHESNVIGTPVWTIPYLGYAAEFLQKPAGRVLTVGIGALAALSVLLPELVCRQKQGGKRRKAPDIESHQGGTGR